MRKLVVANDFLAEAAEVLRQGKRVKVRIDGQSMFPFIIGGKDVVEIDPLPADSELPAWCCPFYQWEGKYMVHRYIGREGDECLMLGDGNLYRIERVKRSEVLGLLRYIYRPDGSVQDCTDSRWLKRGALWYKLKPIRRILLPLFRMIR